MRVMAAGALGIGINRKNSCFFCFAESIHFVNGACAAHTVSMSFFKKHPCLRPTFLLQPKKVGKKGRSLQKFLTAKNGLFLGRCKCSFPTRCKRFKLVNRTSLMISTQTRRPCRVVQLGEAVLLKIPVSPLPFAPKISLFVLKL